MKGIRHEEPVSQASLGDFMMLYLKTIAYIKNIFYYILLFHKYKSFIIDTERWYTLKFYSIIYSENL